MRFDAFTRGRYATDASHYQIMPLGVVTPRTIDDAERAIAICRAEGVPVTPRGGGTSQAGQTVNESLVIDCSQHLNSVLDVDAAGRRCVVEPGIVLDELNRKLKPTGLWFPVDISTASRATIGGMVGNNSCGARSLRYGNTRENVLSIDAVLPDGTRAHFGRMGDSAVDVPPDLVRDLLAIAAREAGEIERRFPKVQRRVGGYNLDALVPSRNDINLAHLLVGSEGTLAFSTRIELKLSPLLGRRAVGAVHFGSFHEAMLAAQHIVTLGPIAVELIDRTMLGLAADIAMFKSTVDAFLRGDPEAILFVEFAEADWDENVRRLKRLVALIGDLGIAWDKPGAQVGRRRRGARSETASQHHRSTHRRPQHHDVDEGGWKAGFLCRRLCSTARSSRRLHGAANRGLRAERHPRHLVRARRSRLLACAARAQSAARQGRPRDARHCRGSLRHGA